MVLTCGIDQVENKGASLALAQRRIILCAHGWVGQALLQCVGSWCGVLSSPPKNPPSRISSALSFLNLQLHAREARGTYANQWLSLSRAKESPTQNDTTLILENLFKQARTYFSKNC